MLLCITNYLEAGTERCDARYVALDAAECGVACGNRGTTANLRTKIMDFRGFDSSII